MKITTHVRFSARISGFDSLRPKDEVQFEFISLFCFLQLEKLFPHLCLAALQTHLTVTQQETNSSLTEDEFQQYEFFRRTASADLIHLAEFAHMQSKLFTRTQLRSINRLCEQANQYQDRDMSFH